MKPRILLLDEPLSALDGVIKESIKQRIRRIADELGLTIIIVTHDPEEALTLSNPASNHERRKSCSICITAGNHTLTELRFC